MTAEKAALSVTCCIQSGMQFFIAKNGGKEREMSTTKETIKVIAEGAEGHTVCPIIDEIAQNISDYYDETSEYYFDEDADFLISSLVAKAYLDGEYEIAASIILIVFELLDLEYAADMLLLIARCAKEDGMKDFMDALFKKDGPFEVENIS